MFAAQRSFLRRLNNGSMKYLNRGILNFVRKDATAFVAKNLRKIFSLDDDTIDEPSADPFDNPEHNYEEKASYDLLYFCLRKLRKREFILVKLHHFYDMGFREIATHINKLKEVAKAMTEESARKAHERALDKLRVCIERYRGGEM